MFHPNTNPADVTFKICQSAEKGNPKLADTEHSERFNWEIHLEPLPEKDLQDIEKVTYKLHESFRNPVRPVFSMGDGFRMKSRGWGICAIKMDILLRNGKVIEAIHVLELPIPEIM